MTNSAAINLVNAVLNLGENEIAPFYQSITEKNYGQALRRITTTNSEASIVIFQALLLAAEKLEFDPINSTNNQGKTVFDFLNKNGPKREMIINYSLSRHNESLTFVTKKLLEISSICKKASELIFNESDLALIIGTICYYLNPADTTILLLLLEKGIDMDSILNIIKFAISRSNMSCLLEYLDKLNLLDQENLSTIVNHEVLEHISNGGYGFIKTTNFLTAKINHN